MDGEQRDTVLGILENTPREVKGKLGEMQSLELCRARPGTPVATGRAKPGPVLCSLAGDNRTPTNIILWKVPAHSEPSPADPRTSPSLLPQGGTPGLEKFIPEVLHGFAPSALPGRVLPQGRMLCLRSAQGASDSFACSKPPEGTSRHPGPGEGLGSWDSCL